MMGSSAVRLLLASEVEKSASFLISGELARAELAAVDGSVLMFGWVQKGLSYCWLGMTGDGQGVVSYCSSLTLLCMKSCCISFACIGRFPLASRSFSSSRRALLPFAAFSFADLPSPSFSFLALGGFAWLDIPSNCVLIRLYRIRAAWPFEMSRPAATWFQSID